ncbi:MAG: asparagine synthase (glutamine-hydrolyzing) [Spartobacteria bacterium]|nr:asparagine synthase (glutamine-hydrolyzing) [Spartobacteria bacterium]
MCGIAGVLQLSDKACVKPEVLEAVTQRLRHRGPDACGLQWVGPCGLGHQRLSIIDLSDAGRQPMSNEDGAVWIVYNGETYNFKDLRAQFGLDAKGHRFVSRTDTEVIIHLYEELGIECVKQLNGMFALALWDNQRRVLHLARDPYGIKPLFYMICNNTFWFASEIKALLAVPEYTPAPSREALHHFLGFDYVPGSLTAFQGIHELRPGWRMEIRPGDSEPRFERFFDIAYKVDHSMSEQDAIHQSREVLARSVERQLIADVPVGVMLSGGMDSSALTALMARTRGDADFHTFSLAFDDASFDESSYADMVADRVGTTHHEIRVTPEKVRDLLTRYLCYIDEPYADGSAIPTYLLAQTATEFVTVLLSGEGGDEFYSGYDTHAALGIRQRYQRIPAVFRRMIRAGVACLPVSHKKLSFEFKAKRFTRGAELDDPCSHYFWRMVLSEEAKKTVLNDPAQFEAFARSEAFFQEAYAHCDARDALNKLLYIDFSYHLPDDLMIKNDRMTMAHSIEARVPFTDNELVRFLATVPVEYKLKGMRKKHLLRTALRGMLPDEVLEKKKVGLEMPYSRWMRGELREFAEETLSLSRLEATGLFSSGGVRKMWEEHQSMKVDHGRALWGLLNYMIWHRHYIERRDHMDYMTPPRTPRPAAATPNKETH